MTLFIIAYYNIFCVILCILYSLVIFLPHSSLNFYACKRNTESKKNVFSL